MCEPLLFQITDIRIPQSLFADVSAIPLFASLLQHSDATLRIAAAPGNDNFKGVDENHNMLIDVGDEFVNALLQLVKSKAVKYLCRVVCVLRGLCVNDLMRSELIRRGRLLALLVLAKLDIMDVLTQIFRTNMTSVKICTVASIHCWSAFHEKTHRIPRDHYWYSTRAVSIR